MVYKPLTELRDEMRAAARGDGKVAAPSASALSRAQIRAALDAAEASLSSGLGRSITKESMREFAEEVKSRGRARLAAEQKSR